MTNWNQYRQSGKYYEQTQLKVIDLGTRHPKNNWWNGFFRDVDIETLVVCDNGEAIPVKGLCMVEQVTAWPYHNDQEDHWVVGVQYRDIDQGTDFFHFNGICELAFKDYAEAGQVKQGSMFYKNQIK